MIEQLGLVELIIYGVVSFGAAILSGIGGGGAGFITTPLLIFLGLSPAQAVATGKLTGLSVSAFSLGSLRSKRQGSKKQLIAIMAMALVIGLLAPLAITNLDSDVYRKLLGIFLLAMIPVVIFKKVGIATAQTNLKSQIIGYTLLVFSMILQAIFSGGMGVLVILVLMSFLGMTALQANIAKRYSQIILNVVITFGVLFTGLLVWPVALIGLFTAGAGGYIGGKLAIQRGDKFIMTVFILLMIVSGVGLLLG